MTNEKAKKIHFLYGVLTSALILTVGIALVVSCVNIYNSGERPFSREVIALAFERLAVPGWACLLAVIGGIVLHFALPVDKANVQPIRCDKALLDRYARNFSELPEETQGKIKAIAKRTALTKWALAAVIVLLYIYPVVYFADPSHFGVADINGDIAKAVSIVLISTIAAFVCIYTAWRYSIANTKKQIALYKENGIKPAKSAQKSTSCNKVNIARWALAGTSVALIIMGIANEGVADVLGKAIRICTECIGLG